MLDPDAKIPKYSRIRAGLNATFVKSTSIRNVQSELGLVESYSVESGRDEQGDHVFIERLDEVIAPGWMREGTFWAVYQRT